EPEPAIGVGVLELLIELHVRVELALGVLPILRLLVLLVLPFLLSVTVLELVLLLAGNRGRRQPSRFEGRRAVRRGAVAGGAVALLLGQERRQRPGEGVDLVRRKDGAVGEMGLVLREQPLEPEQQREVAAPFDRRLRVAGLDLHHRSVECPAACRARGERLFEGLALVYEL